jgi:zinc protease
MKWHEERDGKLQAVTLDQVNAVIRSMIKPELLSHVYAGDFAGAAKKQLHRSNLLMLWFSGDSQSA